MIELFEALEASAPASVLRTSFVLYPLVNAAHILALGLLVSTVLLMDLRVWGWGRAVPVEGWIGLLRPLAVGALGVTLLTGVALFSVQPFTYLENPAFLTKLALIGLGALNVIILRLNPRWGDVTGSETIAVSVRAAAFASLLVWLGVVVAGRWIGFMQ